MFLSDILCCIIKGVIAWYILSNIDCKVDSYWYVIVIIGIFMIIDFVMNMIPNNKKYIVNKRFTDLPSGNFTLAIYYFIFGFGFWWFMSYYTAFGKGSKYEWAYKSGAIAAVLYLYNVLFSMITRLGSYEKSEYLIANTMF